MKIAIVGAGIIGVTTAWELAGEGHDVTVFERRAALAEESSFANGGLVAPGALLPWANPGMSAKALRQLVPLRPAWPLSLREMSWLLARRRALEPAAWLAQSARLRQLALLGRERLDELCEGLNLRIDSASGVLVLLRTAKEQAWARAALPALREAGVGALELTPEAAREVEPALASLATLAGAVHLPGDGVFNCREFAAALKAQAQALGARFAFNSHVAPLDKAAPATLQVSMPDAPSQALAFEAVVLCAGLDSARLLHRIGLTLPLEPVHGYSISAAMGEPLNAPRSAVWDPHHQASIVRLGQRVRVAGHAAFGSRAGRRDAGAISALYKVLHEWFPGAAQLAGPAATVQHWQGVRPCLPDGAPVLGASGLPGLWLNLGHGNLGWTLACASARTLADQIAGRPPAADLTGLDIGRFQR